MIFVLSVLSMATRSSWVFSDPVCAFVGSILPFSSVMLSSRIEYAAPPLPTLIMRHSRLYLSSAPLGYTETVYSGRGMVSPGRIVRSEKLGETVMSAAVPMSRTFS